MKQPLQRSAQHDTIDRLSLPLVLGEQLVRLGLVKSDDPLSAHTSALAKLYAAQINKPVVNTWGGVKRLLAGTSTPQLDTFFLLLAVLGGHAYLQWQGSGVVLPIADRATFWQVINDRYEVYKESGAKAISQIANDIAPTPEKIPSVTAQLYRMLTVEGQTNRTIATVLPLIEALGGNLKILWVIRVTCSVSLSPASIEDLKQIAAHPEEFLEPVGTATTPPINSGYLMTHWVVL